MRVYLSIQFLGGFNVQKIQIMGSATEATGSEISEPHKERL